MEAVKDELIQHALATTVLDKGSTELHEALLAVLWERKGPELYAKALEQVRQEQEAIEATRQERQAAEQARQRRALETEADQLIDEGIARGIRDKEEEFQERLHRAISQRDEARGRASRAEDWIIDYFTHLLPDGKRVLLRHAETTRFRMYSLNLILSRLGFEVKARLTDTPETVAVETAPARWEQHSRFRLVRIGPGVVDETADEDEVGGVKVEASRDGPTIN